MKSCHIAFFFGYYDVLAFCTELIPQHASASTEVLVPEHPVVLGCGFGVDVGALSCQVPLNNININKHGRSL